MGRSKKGIGSLFNRHIQEALLFVDEGEEGEPFDSDTEECVQEADCNRDEVATEKIAVDFDDLAYQRNAKKQEYEPDYHGNPVHFLTTADGTSTSAVNRRVGRERISVRAPIGIKNYNKGMQAVDRHDQLRERFSFKNRVKNRVKNSRFWRSDGAESAPLLSSARKGLRQKARGNHPVKTYNTCNMCSKSSSNHQRNLIHTTISLCPSVEFPEYCTCTYYS